LLPYSRNQSMNAVGPHGYKGRFFPGETCDHPEYCIYQNGLGDTV
jgi:hypothetical protein